MDLGKCMQCEAGDLTFEPIKEYKIAASERLKEIASGYPYDTPAKYKFKVKVADIEFVVICDQCGHVDELIERYKDKYRPQNQERIVHGVCVNPKHRHWFNNMSNSLRPVLEQSDWYGRPYIVTGKYRNNDSSYDVYVKRLRKIFREEQWADEILPTEAAWLALDEASRDCWLANWPKGVSYTVYVYDGGSWDRSTWRGTFTTLGLAVAYCNNGDQESG